MSKPILCLDFDGVLHSYESGWKGGDVIPDQMVPGSAEFLDKARHQFRIAVFSSRSNQHNGILAMQFWLKTQLYKSGMDTALADEVFAEIEWPTEKPPAFLTIDDRAVTFTGVWPDISALASFTPWNKK